MAILVIGAAGAYVGAAVGIGAAAGWAIGTYLYSSYLAPGQKKSVRSSELNDLRVMGTEYGEAIPYIIGTMAIAGQMWWNSDRRPIVTTTTTSQGGKGGGKSTTESTVTTYDMDALIGLCDNRIIGVMRIWDEGKLVWSAHPDSPQESIDASEETVTWDRMTVYTGDPAQMPDPTYEAAFGVGNVPAYRHRASVFFEGLHLGQSGRVPNFTFEIVTDGGEGATGPWIEVGQRTSKVDISAQQPHHGVSDGTYVYMVHSDNYINRITLPGLATTDWLDVLGASSAMDWGDIELGAGILVATSYFFRTQWSEDKGETWVAGPNFEPSSAGWWLAYGNGTFVAVNLTSQDPIHCRVSGDGKNWTVGPDIGHGWNDIAFGGGWFVAVSNDSVKQPQQVIRSNSNGNTWEHITVPTGKWNRICYSGAGHFVAIMDGINNLAVAQMNGAVMTSSDHGATWTLRDASHSRLWCGLASNENGVVIAVSRDNASDNSMKSLDHGETWEIVPLTKPMQFNSITWGKNGYFYAQASNADPSYGGGTRNWGMVLGASGGTIISETVTLEETVRRLLKRCGMVEGTQFDVSALASVTRPVRALYVSQVSPTRQSIDALASTYFFDMTVSDKLYCIPRGGAIAATIPYEDLGAAFDGASDDLDQFILKNSGDLEFPARVSLVYRNTDNDYQVDTQSSDRLISASPDTAKVITLPMCATPGEMKQVADVMLFNQAVNMLSCDSIKVLGDYVRLEPTDPVSVFDAQGNSYRMRLTSRRDEYPLLEYSAVLDDVAVLTSSGVTDENYEDSVIVEAVPLTLDLLLDIPMLRDADTDLGMYAVAKGATAARWPGCVIYVSGDGVNYESVGAIAYANIFGTCQTTLGNWTRGRLIDELNRVTVNVGPGVSLSSSTYERVLNNKTINACVIGDEVLQFIDAAAVSDGVWTLSRLLRGSQGTERVMGTHGAGERFALLDPGRLGRVPTPNNLLGVPLDYKFVTVGKPLDSDAPETVANTGVNLKPISPVYLQVYRDPANNDATISWERRSRFTVRVLGPGGIDVPPDEVGWEIDVYSSGAYATKVRTITATLAARPSAVYYAAEQSADGLTPGAPLFLRIYPMSGNVGRGFPLTASM